MELTPDKGINLKIQKTIWLVLDEEYQIVETYLAISDLPACVALNRPIQLKAMVMT